MRTRSWILFLGNLALVAVTLQAFGSIEAAQKEQAQSSSARDGRYEIFVSGIT